MIITTSLHNFIVSFDYNLKVLAEVKAISGARWMGHLKHWTIPIHQSEKVEALRAKYCLADKYKVPELVMPIPPMPELTIHIPLKRKPYAYQEQGIAAGLNFKRFINGDDMGLGKTLQAVATIKGAKALPALVICPATLKENWRREFAIATDLRVDIMTDSIKATWPQFIKMGMVDVFLVNYESLKKYFVVSIDKKKDMPLKLTDIKFRPEISLFKCIVLDEIHKTKDSSTLQSKLCKGITAGKEWVIGLTGTPVQNKTKDLISQLSIIGQLKAIGGYGYFIKRYCGGDGKGNTNLRELNYKLSTTCFFRRMKKEVLLDLPDKTRSIYTCDITTRKEYNDAMADFAAYLKEYTEKTDSEIDRSMRAEILVRMTKCKNISARGKMNEVIEYVDEIVESGEKVVVFIHQKEIALHLLKHYPAAVSVRGDDKHEDRQSAVDRFQNDAGVQIIICSIKAAGVGITLTASSRVAFVELPWHSADSDQCEDRCNRLGQKNAVQATYFIGKNTIDEDIYELIESKRAVAGEVTGTVDDIQRILIDKMAIKMGIKKEETV